MHNATLTILYSHLTSPLQSVNFFLSFLNSSNDARKPWIQLQKYSSLAARIFLSSWILFQCLPVIVQNPSRAFTLPSYESLGWSEEKGLHHKVHRVWWIVIASAVISRLEQLGLVNGMEPPPADAGTNWSERIPLFLRHGFFLLDTRVLRLLIIKGKRFGISDMRKNT